MTTSTPTRHPTPPLRYAAVVTEATRIHRRTARAAHLIAGHVARSAAHAERARRALRRGVDDLRRLHVPA